MSDTAAQIVPQVQSGRKAVEGTVFVLFAEALILPTGLVTSIFLTRSLGPAEYGMLALAGTLIAWVQGSISALFARAAVKLIAESPDWEPAAAAVIWLHLLISASAAALLLLMADTAAAAFKEPSLAPFIRLYSLDVVLFSVAHAKRLVLVGTGQYRKRAVAGAARWTSRMILILVLVQAGFGLNGAILGNIGASLIELIFNHRHARPGMFVTGLPWRALFIAAAPLSIAAVCLRLFEKLDLMLLKALGATTAESGLYGAVQNLTTIPSMLALACTPLLLSTLTGSVRQGETAKAQEAAANTLRFVALLLPLVAIGSGAAGEFIPLVFGEAYRPAGSLLSILVWAAFLLMFISIATIILVAAGKSNWIPAITVPLLPAAALLHLILIPRFGPAGAAWGTTIASLAGAAAVAWAVYRAWGVAVPASSLVRTCFVSGVVFAAAWCIPAARAASIVKIAVLSIGALSLFVALGEIRAEWFRHAQHWVSGRLRPAEAKGS